MSVVILDSGPVGLLAKRGGVTSVDACLLWQDNLVAQNIRVILPEIVDYEVRRELVRLNATSSIARLDRLATLLEYLPLTTAAMRKAAELWAQGRQSGQPTADPKELDMADASLVAAAEALSLTRVFTFDRHFYAYRLANGSALEVIQ